MSGVEAAHDVMGLKKKKTSLLPLMTSWRSRFNDVNVDQHLSLLLCCCLWQRAFSQTTLCRCVRTFRPVLKFSYFQEGKNKS